MRYIILSALVLFNVQNCNKSVREKIVCNEKFFLCASECSSICKKTIKKPYEFGKCYTTCNRPCRVEHCKKI